MTNNLAPANPTDDANTQTPWGGLTAHEARAGHGSHAPITDWWARLWYDRFNASCLPDLLTKWRGEDNARKYPGGRKPAISDTVTLSLSMLLALEGQPVNPTTLGHMLETRLSPEARDVFDIAHLYGSKSRDWYSIGYRALHRVIDTFDGWVAPRQLMLLDKRIEIEAGRDEAHVNKMRARGVEFNSALLDLVINMQPEEHQRTAIALSVDQTSVRAGSQQRRWKRDKTTGQELPQKNSSTNKEIDRPVLELEAGLYPKEKGAPVKDPNGVEKFVNSNWEMAFVADIIVDTREDPTVDHTDEPPLLIRAISLATPNKQVGENTLALLDSIAGRGYDITRLTFDRGYNNLMSGGFHEGLRDRGIPTVQDYRDEQKGMKDGAGGSKFVEGDYHCPGTAPELLTATERYDAAKGDISEAAWREDLAKRWDFILHVKDVKPNGKVRLSCPALGPSATVVCAAREMHEKAFRGGRKPNAVLKKNMPKRMEDLPVCCQESITIDPKDHPREQQSIRYGSDRWISTFRTDRNTIESLNNSLKSDFRIDATAERRMRGLAANQYVLAFKATALNYKRIANYARNQLKMAELEKRRTNITPIRPDIQVAATKKAGVPAETKVRNRDRQGWSNYRRNAKPIRGIVMTKEEREAPREN